MDLILCIWTGPFIYGLPRGLNGHLWPKTLQKHAHAIYKDF